MDVAPDRQIAAPIAFQRSCSSSDESGFRKKRSSRARPVRVNVVDHESMGRRLAVGVMLAQMGMIGR